MDKRLLLLKKKNQETALRARKMNRVAKHLQDEHIGLLELRYMRNNKQLYKEMQLVENELNEMKLEKLSTREPLPDIQQTANQKTPCPAVITEHLSDVAADQRCKCRYGINNGPGPCKMFPCLLPYSYHSMEFQSRPQHYSILSNYEDIARHSLPIRPPSACIAPKCYPSDNIMSTMRKPPRFAAKERERGLHKVITHMRIKNRTIKPKDWAINYGAPIPRRIFSKPTIFVSNIMMAR